MTESRAMCHDALTEGTTRQEKGPSPGYASADPLCNTIEEPAVCFFFLEETPKPHHATSAVSDILGDHTV